MSIKIINFPRINDPRGNLTFIEAFNQIPFEIKRVFWTYDVPGGEVRGGHAFKKQEEVIIALSGSFDVVLTKDNEKLEKYSLNRSYYGLYLPANTWRHIENFSTNALVLHVVSEIYSEEDYIRDFDKFKLIYNES
jgi:dTDP-4-dehydrorhamnose 3,5-epimerase-like enzyme